MADGKQQRVAEVGDVRQLQASQAAQLKQRHELLASQLVEKSQGQLAERRCLPKAAQHHVKRGRSCSRVLLISVLKRERPQRRRAGEQVQPAVLRRRGNQGAVIVEVREPAWKQGSARRRRAETRVPAPEPPARLKGASKQAVEVVQVYAACASAQQQR